MKKIVKGNDFVMRIPVMKIVDGEKQAFPLPACTDIMVRLCSAFRRYELTYTIDAKDDNVLLARVEGDKMPCGSYALEVRGKVFGNDWRSNEYEQLLIVDNNEKADTEFGKTDEGENSVEMDTAVVYLPPSAELSRLITEAEGLVGKADAAVANAEKAVKEAENVDIDLNGGDLEITRKSGEKKGFDLMQLKGEKGDKGNDGAQGPQGERGPQGEKGDQGIQGEKGEQGERGLKGDTGATGEVGPKGDKGNAFTYSDFTEEELENLKKPATDAASDVNKYLDIVKLPVVEVPTNTAELTMQPNRMYAISVGDTLTLNIAAPTDTTVTNEYQGFFDTGATTPTVAWPANVTWAFAASVEAKQHYEFSIRYAGGFYHGIVYGWAL